MLWVSNPIENICVFSKLLFHKPGLGSMSCLVKCTIPILSMENAINDNHETERPWPLHFKHSYWWKRRSRSKFKLHTMLEAPMKYVNPKWMDVKSTWIPTWHRMDHVSWSLILLKNHLLGVGLIHETGRPWQMHTTVGLFYFHHVWGPAWIDIHWNRIWLRPQSHMTSHSHLRVRDHTTWFWRCVRTTFGYFFFWALTISWSRVLACVGSGTKPIGLVMPRHGSLILLEKT